MNLPEIIPVFPLPGALLLPRARLPLHIFEPRFLAMIEECMATPQRLIGMVQPISAPAGQAPRLHGIGCAGRLTGFSETEDGRYMITLTGKSRFRLLSEPASDTPYRIARVDWAGFGRDLGGAESDSGFDRPAFFSLLGRYFRAQRLSTDWESLKDAEEELLVNSLAMLCPISPEDKQALLEAPSLQTRRETLVTLLEFALRSADGGEGVMQ